MEVLGVDDGAEGGPLRVHVRGRSRRPAREDCGGSLWSDGERPQELVDLPAFGRSVVLVTIRAGRWATRQVGRGLPVKDVADELECSWYPVNASVLRWGEALLAADTERIGATQPLGLDEHLMWRWGQFRAKTWATSIVDVGRG